MANARKLDILGNEFELHVGELETHPTGDVQFGLMDARVQRITLNREIDATWRTYVLLHEILHALTFMGHLQFLRLPDHPGVDDEAKVDAIASLLSEVLAALDYAEAIGKQRGWRQV
jgi:hypothetical protein